MVSRIVATLGDLGKVAATLIVGEIVRFPSIHPDFKRSQRCNTLTHARIVNA